MLNKEEKERYAREHLKMISYVMKEFNVSSMRDMGHSFISSDLRGAGLIGFTKALNTYDKERNISFTTYCYPCIKNEIMQFIRDNKKHQRCSTDIMELHEQAQNEDIFSFARIGIFKEESSVIDSYLETDAIKFIEKCVKTMENKREKEVLNYLLGINGYSKITQDEVAELLGYSQPYICKIRKRALEKLRYKLSNTYELDYHKKSFKTFHWS